MLLGLSDAASFVPELLEPGYRGVADAGLSVPVDQSWLVDSGLSCRGWIDEAAEAILRSNSRPTTPGSWPPVHLLVERLPSCVGFLAFLTVKRIECERLLGLRCVLRSPS